MKFNNKIATIVTVIAVSFILYGLTVSAHAATTPEKKSNVKIQIQTVLYVGDMDVIDCSEKAVCKSSDESVVYIDEDGFMVAAAPGEAIITVKDGKNSQKISIYVPNECIPGDHDFHVNKNGSLECSKCHKVK